MGEIAAPDRTGRKGGASQRVYHHLREAIVRLEFAPGTPLDKPVLAQLLGVSRFPVGEAINRLAAEGLVEVAPQSGSRVALIRIADVRENMFLRRAIETEAIRTLTKTWSHDHVAAMLRNLRYQQAAIDVGDREGFHVLDLRFHAILLDGLGYGRVREAAETARLGLERVRRLLNTKRRQEVTLAEHYDIVEALAKRETTRAAAAMERHLAAVMAELESLAVQKPELFADLKGEGP